jgi:hypothetical protein
VDSDTYLLTLFSSSFFGNCSVTIICFALYYSLMKLAIVVADSIIWVPLFCFNHGFLYLVPYYQGTFYLLNDFIMFLILYPAYFMRFSISMHFFYLDNENDYFMHFMMFGIFLIVLWINVNRPISSTENQSAH